MSGVGWGSEMSDTSYWNPQSFSVKLLGHVLDELVYQLESILFHAALTPKLY